MSLVTGAVYAASAYFVVFGAGFLFRPELVERFSLRWSTPAGRTEVRCYYGAVSWALAAFLVYLVARHHAVDALTGVLFLATGVLVTRIAGTAVDGGWSDPYTRLAIPTESLFVVALLVVRLAA